MSSYPTLNVIAPDTLLNLYRPSIGPDGSTAIFEGWEQFKNDKSAILYCINDLNQNEPTPFLKTNDPAPQTRNDWCWASGEIVYCQGEYLNTTRCDGLESTRLNNTKNLIYGSWSQDGSTLAAMNQNQNLKPHPHTCLYSYNSREISVSNINGKDIDNNNMYGGMPSIDPTNSNTVAFAGQPAIETWHPNEDGKKEVCYNQNYNYIFLSMRKVDGTYFSTSLEPVEQLQNFEPSFQGRAPSWSPNGNRVAFESNRNSSTGDSYQIFIYNDSDPAGAPVAVTDPRFDCQHAKWFPCGTKLILSVKSEGKNPIWRIAWIDISSYVN
ncbi:TolB family protein [Microbulbifer sp. VTAC004]|uniref:TolB family protein n=1 Tax=unclassified Microbulbifer TaxID=2619833 RepID=UPI00403A546F